MTAIIRIRLIIIINSHNKLFTINDIFVEHKIVRRRAENFLKRRKMKLEKAESKSGCIKIR